MSEPKVIFIFNGIKTIIQCNLKDEMNKIIQTFERKINLNLSKNLCYLYNGKIINKDLTYEELINNVDKETNSINILVDEINKAVSNNNIKDSELIICPKCSEDIFIQINSYKIKLYQCKNNHEINDMSIKEFIDSQKIDISKIICDICKENNMSNIYNNEMFKCIKCDKNICPLCKSNHDKNHIIVKYNQKNYICNEHNEIYTKYCFQCNKNICMTCTKDHKNHKGVYYGDLLNEYTMMN